MGVIVAMGVFIFALYYLVIISFVDNSCHCETIIDSSFHNKIEEINLDVRSLKTELITIKDELTAVRNELLSSRKELTTVRNEILSSRNEQIVARNELLSTRKELAKVRNEILSNRNEQIAMRNELLSTRSDLASTKSDFIIFRNEMLANKANILERDSIKEGAQTVHSYNIHAQAEETESKQTKSSPTLTREASNLFNKSEKTCGNLARLSTVLLRTVSQEKAFTRSIIDRISKNLSTVANALENIRNQTELINETVADNKRLQNDAFDQLRKLNERNKARVDSVTSNLLQYGKDTQESKENILELSAQIQEMRAANNNTHSNLQTQLTRHTKEVQKEFSSIGKCQTGDRIGIHSVPVPKYPLSITVHFDPSFKNKPSVMYGPILLDNHRDRNLRYTIYLTEVTTEYFKLTIKTWGDTHLYGIRLRWMACP